MIVVRNHYKTRGGQKIKFFDVYVDFIWILTTETEYRVKENGVWITKKHTPASLKQWAREKGYK